MFFNIFVISYVHLGFMLHLLLFNESLLHYLSIVCYHQARAEGGGGAVGAWAPAHFPLDAQSALLSRQFLAKFQGKNFFVFCD